MLYDLSYDHTEVPEVNERVTVTLPEEVVRNIDLRERNRSRFVLRAVQNELERQRKEELRRSLRAPHADSESLAQEEIAEWMSGLPESGNDLVDVGKSTRIKWIPGTGWITGE
jgi:hypothetical protein